MASFRIPEPLRGGLTLLSSLPEDAFKELVAALRVTPPVIYRPGFVDRISSNVPSISKDQLQQALNTIFGLSVANAGADVSVTEFLDDIASSLGQSEGTPEQFASLPERLRQLLEVDSLRIGGKAQELLFENQHNLVAARVLTDIRPVFKPDLEDGLYGAIVMHTLKLEYLETGKRQEFYVALDTNDVDKLI